MEGVCVWHVPWSCVSKAMMMMVVVVSLFFQYFVTLNTDSVIVLYVNYEKLSLLHFLKHRAIYFTMSENKKQ